MNQESLLIELFTEELPPKALQRLSNHFAEAIVDGLLQQRLISDTDKKTVFATPRRMAVLIADVAQKAAPRVETVKGPSLSVAFDANELPTIALQKWCEKQGVSLADLSVNRSSGNPKDHHVLARLNVNGAKLDEVLENIVEQAIAKLPIPKMMRWGDSEHRFVRPVHGLIALHGERIIPISLLGLTAGNITQGHRFLSKKINISIQHANTYEAQLGDEGVVIVNFDARRHAIETQLTEKATALGLDLGETAAWQTLLDEVCALVEFPAVYVCEFDREFLNVPQECLILTMRTNQKYFPLFSRGRLSHQFLVVSNMQIADPRNIIEGNQRVVRPRLSDAQFFYETDLKCEFDSWRDALNRVVYHNQLGTQGERFQRLETEAARLHQLAGSPDWISLADIKTVINHCKLDLMSGMVGEFPELQGVMGRYYALHKGMPAAMANALESHYQPRSAADNIAADDLGRFVALVDRIEMLRSFWALGLQPTGDKDPFGMRRAALGALRILLETPWHLPLSSLLDSTELQAFVLERLRGYLKEQGQSADVVESVMTCAATQPLHTLNQRIAALTQFKFSPAAASLASAHKRMSQILKKNQIDTSQAATIQTALLQEPSERSLAEHVARLSDAQGGFQTALHTLDFSTALQQLAQIKEPMDAFFDNVMVMADDLTVRQNRLNLLVCISQRMEQIADFSQLN